MHRKTLFAFGLLALVALALTACAGPEGPAGAVGPPAVCKGTRGQCNSLKRGYERGDRVGLAQYGGSCLSKLTNLAEGLGNPHQARQTTAGPGRSDTLPRTTTTSTTTKTTTTTSSTTSAPKSSGCSNTRRRVLFRSNA